MSQDLYFGEYAKFYVKEKNSVADFMGADNLVGDRFTIDIHDEGNRYTAYVVNKFGKVAGELEERVIRRIKLAQAKGWHIDAFLSFIAFTEGTDEEHPGQYWGEMAILAYDPKLDEVMVPFCQKLMKAMADGARPQVDFGSKSVDMLISQKGAWFPTDSAPRVKMGKRSSIIKDHQTANERLIEQSRKKNPGCYIVSWAFIIVVVAAILYALHSCGVF